MHCRVAYAAGNDLEPVLCLELARMRWELEGLIDDIDGVIDMMPWWIAWKENAAWKR
jgi:hypothetical protein